MNADQNNNAATKKPSGLVSQGIELGGAAGCLGGGVYLLLYGLLSLLSGIPEVVRTHSFAPLLGGLLIAIVSIVVGTVIGVFPAVLIGVVTGALIGLTQRLVVQHLNLVRSRAVGFLICSLVSMLLHAALWWWNVLGAPDGVLYVLLLRVPTLIYVGLGVWLSGRLFRKVQSSSTRKQTGNKDVSQVYDIF